MNLLLFECFSGGGFSDQNLSSNILCEAYGMLRGLVTDFKTAGYHVTTFMDSRLWEFNPLKEADKVVRIFSPFEAYKKLKELSNLVDATYIIAPESNQTLAKLLETIEASGTISLNCKIDAVRRNSNKITAYKKLKETGLKIPETIFLDIHEKTEYIKRLLKDLGYPLVIKPIDGVGCSGVSLLKNEKNIGKAIRKIAKESVSPQFLAQKLIKGKPASASVFSTGDKAVAVTLNKQQVTLASPNEESIYHGGLVPFNHRLENEALRAAEKVVEMTNGLRGYVGVDLILSEKEPFLIEINPRLTTSYIGLKKSVNFNTAEVLISAITRHILPNNIQTKCFTFFSKVRIPLSGQFASETLNIKDVISPPFPTEEETNYSLIASTSKSPGGAQSAFYRVKKKLLSIYGCY